MITDNPTLLWYICIKAEFTVGSLFIYSFEQVNLFCVNITLCIGDTDEGDCVTIHKEHLHAGPSLIDHTGYIQAEGGQNVHSRNTHTHTKAKWPFGRNIIIIDQRREELTTIWTIIPGRLMNNKYLFISKRDREENVSRSSCIYVSSLQHLRVFVLFVFLFNFSKKDKNRRHRSWMSWRKKRCCSTIHTILTDMTLRKARLELVLTILTIRNEH